MGEPRFAAIESSDGEVPKIQRRLFLQSFDDRSKGRNDRLVGKETPFEKPTEQLSSEE